MSPRLLTAALARRTGPAARGEAAVPLDAPRLLRSAGFRFALLFAAMFTSAAVTLVAVLWWAMAGALIRQTDSAIRADATALIERWRDDDRDGLIEAIEDRLIVEGTGDAIYLLTDSETGGHLAGNMNRLPEGLTEDARWYRVRIQRDDYAVDARLHRVELPGLQLLVGRDETERQRLTELLTEGLAWASGAVIAFALAGAWLIRLALQRRMRPAFATIAAIAGGDLASRVVLSGRGDEFDSLAATINIMLDRIETLMAGVRGVSDAIAHDLRTPIARARAKLEDALASAPPADTAKGEALRAAVEQGIADLDAITRIFQALLRIAEAEAGSRRAAFARFDLPQVLHDAAEFYEATADSRDQVLSTGLPERLELVGDRDLLLQAVANLLDNAIKFTPCGGQVQLSARIAGEWVEIAVADDGPGLAPGDRVQAGERFFRADPARATPGSGLGLSLVRAVASLHGGELVLEDAVPGRRPPGLRAILRLPAR